MKLHQSFTSIVCGACFVGGAALPAQALEVIYDNTGSVPQYNSYVTGSEYYGSTYFRETINGVWFRSADNYTLTEVVLKGVVAAWTSDPAKASSVFFARLYHGSPSPSSGSLLSLPVDVPDNPWTSTGSSEFRFVFPESADTALAAGETYTITIESSDGMLQSVWAADGGAANSWQYYRSTDHPAGSVYIGAGETLWLTVSGTRVGEEAPVPDSASTLGLLGLALVGLAGSRRRVG